MRTTKTKRVVTASVWKEGAWFVAQALETDVASQGETKEDALANLREALELHFEPPVPTSTPELRRIEVDIAADWDSCPSGGRPQAEGGGFRGGRSEGQPRQVRQGLP